jgi:ABC-type lipoprotein release transport system permease subunit
LIALLLGGTILAALLAAAVPSLRAMRTDMEELLQS